MSRIPHQLTMAVIIGNRGFFPSYLVAEAREQASVLFERLGINTIMLNDTQTELGGVETRQDAKVCAELFPRSPRQDSRCGGTTAELWR